MKNPLVRWLLILNGVIIILWAGFLAKRSWNERQARQSQEAKLVGFYVRDAEMSKQDALFLREAKANSRLRGTLTDEEVDGIIRIMNEGVSNPDDRFLRQDRAFRISYGINPLLNAKSYSKSQQARLAEALPPFPSTAKYPDQRLPLAFFDAIARRFDDPVAKERMVSALAQARKGDTGEGGVKIVPIEPEAGH